MRPKGEKLFVVEKDGQLEVFNEILYAVTLKTTANLIKRLAALKRFGENGTL